MMTLINNEHARITFPIAIVVSRFNREVTEALQQGALAELARHKFSEQLITVIEVPGAVEIPVVAQRLARTQKYDAIVAIGAVIRGETAHFDYVCQQVSQGCQQVALQTDIPVIFGVLTTDTTEQALARAGGAMGNKGADAINAAVEMVATLAELNSNAPFRDVELRSL